MKAPDFIQIWLKEGKHPNYPAKVNFGKQRNRRLSYMLKLFNDQNGKLYLIQLERKKP